MWIYPSLHNSCNDRIYIPNKMNHLTDRACIYYSRSELEDLIRFLPGNHYMQSKLRKAYKNIFGDINE